MISKAASRTPAEGFARKQREEGFLYLPDGKIHYLDWGGTGRQAHFLHANGFCAGTYAPFLEYLDALHVFASDIRGHGDSDRVEGKRIRHWRIFADDLKQLIEKVLSPPVVGIGHSLGAVTTYIAAARHPHLFSSIILIDPVLLPRRMLSMIGVMKMLGLRGAIPLARRARRRIRAFQSREDAFQRFAAGKGIFRSWSSEFIDAYLACGLFVKDAETAVLKCDPEIEAQIFESVPLDVWKYGKKIRCPVLAIRGAHSDTFLGEAAERLKETVPDCELRTVSGAGHFIPMERPEVCAGLILDFIESRKHPT